MSLPAMYYRFELVKKMTLKCITQRDYDAHQYYLALMIQIAKDIEDKKHFKCQ